jgi:putative FmdB family regulatory protein
LGNKPNRRNKILLLKERKGKRIVPIYVYKCSNCGTKFDRLCKYDTIDEPTTCPSCGVRDYHDNVIGNCHFSFVGGMPSYGGDGVERLEEDE